MNNGLKKIFCIGMVAILGVLCACSSEGDSEEMVENTGNETTEEMTEEMTEETTDKYEIANVEFVSGTTWWNLAYEGMQEQAEYYGDVEVTTVGPQAADAAEQAQLVEDLITKGVDAITIVPADADAMESVLQKARDAGIYVVVQEAPGVENRDADLEMSDDSGFGKQFVDELVKLHGDKGGYAIFVSSLTIPSHVTRYESIVNYAKENYPDLYLITDPIPDASDLDLVYNTTTNLIQTYGDELIGIMCTDDASALAVARAVEDAGKTDDISVHSRSLPSAVAEYVKEGKIAPYENFSPYDNGRVLLSMARWLCEGNDIRDLSEIPNCGEDGVASVKWTEGNVMYVDAMYTINADNVDDFDW